MSPIPSAHRVALTGTETGPFQNRLVRAHSPYLLQHAHNPVDWYPWGDEAFERAAELERPVFLSIGYSACHWCHVMERESFEDPRVAALLNAHFVSIKVDREEHPAVDAFYMDALVHMTGEGGWPASLWLGPDRVPFQAGTYYPPHPRYGLPSFSQALRRIADQWGGRREAIDRAATRVRTTLAPTLQPGPAAAPPGLEAVEAGVKVLLEAYDHDSGGWGGQARFPQAPRLDLLLAWATSAGSAAESATDARRVASHYLDVLDRSGVHDHVGGGFHRYAVDPDWAVPHFEKMLYDNAMLARSFTWGWKLTGTRRFATVAATTLEYMRTELGRDDGAFAASQDADDSEGEEGSTYTWTPEQLLSVVGPVRAEAIAAAYGVVAGGNFENGGSVLRRRGDASVLAGARPKLLAARRARPQPARDDKAVVAWNGMALTALAEGGRWLGDERYLIHATRLGRLLLAARDDAGLLPRTLAPESPAGVLADHAHVVEGLLALYEATGAPWALGGAAELGRQVLATFRDPETGGLRPLPADDHSLPLARVSWVDGAEPSGAGVAVGALLRLAHLETRGIDHAVLHELLQAAGGAWRETPASAPRTLLALAGAYRPPWTVVLSGAELTGLAGSARRAWHPWTLVAERPSDPALAGEFGVFSGKEGAAPRAWICEGRACRLPLSDPEALAEALAPPSRLSGR